MVLMSRSWIYVVFAATIALAACGTAAQNESAAATASGEPRDISVLYEQRCATCHGKNGNMGMGGAKKLTESEATKEEIIGQVRYGKGTMPPFGEMLSAEEIEAMADFVIRLRPQTL